MGEEGLLYFCGFLDPGLGNGGGEAEPRVCLDGEAPGAAMEDRLFPIPGQDC